MRAGVLVTGGAKRVGRAIAEALSADGWFVCIHYNGSGAAAAALVEDLRRAGGRAVALQADLADVAATEALVERAAAAAGGLDALVNNASLFENDDLASMTADTWERNMAVNLRAPALLSRDFARALPPERRGCIVNLVDQKLWNLNPDFLSYTVAKAGLHALTEMLAMTLAPRIRACGIAPGLLLPSGKMTRETFERVHGRTPLGFGPTVAEIVAAVRLILATPSLTGQTLIIDGGESLQRRLKDVQFEEAAWETSRDEDAAAGPADGR
ncbi:MAG: SDR family oxidoreductase [Alphaproteobacteria bacterium]